jgi:hypothetical protein
MTVLDQLQGLPERGDRIVQNADLRIHLAEREEVGGSLRGQHQLHVLEVRSGGLVRRIGGLDAASGPPEEIRLVTQHERQVPRVLRDGPVDHASQGGTIRRETKPLERGRHAGLRVEVAERNRSQRARLPQSRACRDQVLIRREHARLQPIQLSVPEDSPPRAFRNLISWIARPPRPFRPPCRRRWRRWGHMIIRSDSVARRQQNRQPS